MLLQTTRDIVGHLKVARCARRHPSLPTPTTTTGTSPNPPLQSLSTSSTHKLRSLIYPTPAPPLYTSRLIFKCAHAHRSLASHNSAEARVEARVSSVDGRSACCAASSVRAAGACGVRCRRQGSGVMESGRRVYCCGSDVAETYWWAGWAWVVVRRGVDDGLVSGGASCA